VHNTYEETNEYSGRRVGKDVPWLEPVATKERILLEHIQGNFQSLHGRKRIRNYGGPGDYRQLPRCSNERGVR
jgi:hypothetical protein